MELQFSVSHYRYDGVAYLYAENSVRNNISPAPREPGWLADSAYLDSHCPSRKWSPSITGWNSPTEHDSTYLILKVPLFLPPSLRWQLALCSLSWLVPHTDIVRFYEPAHRYEGSRVGVYSIKYWKRERNKIDGPIARRT